MNDSARTWRGISWPSSGEMLVSEIFGPTLQGEGPSCGKSAVFVRLGACNLACDWCDTGYTWSKDFDLRSELGIMSTREVEKKVTDVGGKLVVITGGEPALQATEVEILARRLAVKGYVVDFETSGTVPLGGLADKLNLIVVSPKLSNSKQHEHQRLRLPVLAQLASQRNVVFKFVVEVPAQLAEVEDLVTNLKIEPERVWVMPEARSTATLIRRLGELAGPVSGRGWSLSNRLQVLLWDSERGR